VECGPDQGKDADFKANRQYKHYLLVLGSPNSFLMERPGLDDVLQDK
jgi:hypothetical protein